MKSNYSIERREQIGSLNSPSIPSFKEGRRKKLSDETKEKLKEKALRLARVPSVLVLILNKVF